MSPTKTVSYLDRDDGALTISVVEHCNAKVLVQNEPDAQASLNTPLGKEQSDELTDVRVTRSESELHPPIAREKGCVYTPGRAATVDKDSEMTVQAGGDAK